MKQFAGVFDGSGAKAGGVAARTALWGEQAPTAEEGAIVAERWLLTGPRGVVDATDRSQGVAMLGQPRFADVGLGRRAQRDGFAPVLAERFAEEGVGVLDGLRGPYALAIADAVDGGRVLLAIDRMGIGDLYWGRTPDGWVFASSLTVLNCWPGLTRRLNPQALFDYLWFHMIPAPQTVWQEIYRLEPGSHLLIQSAEAKPGVHGRVHFSNENGGSDVAELSSRFLSLVGDGVDRAIEGAAAEDVGSFLSGGTDSSTVTGQLGRATGQPARCFSIGFDQEGFDEMEYARLSARHFSAEPHEYYVTPDDIVEFVPRVASVYGQPFGNSSVIPTFFCARLARQHGIGRLLAGDGGDELFGGNERYAKQKIFSLYDRVPGALRSGLLEPFAEHAGFVDGIYPLRKIRRYIEQARVPLPDRLESYNLVSWFGVAEIFELEFLASVDPLRPLELRRKVWSETDAATPLNRILAQDFRFTLADNDLRKVGAMCELAGVDVAYPLLDDELVDFSCQLPIDMKVKGQRLRYLFKEALTGFLPIEVIRKTKQGFGLPFGAWVLAHPPLTALAEDLMASFRQRGVIKPAFIEQLMGQWLPATPNYYGTFLWLFIIMEFWFRDCQTDQQLSVTRVSDAQRQG